MPGESSSLLRPDTRDGVDSKADEGSPARLLESRHGKQDEEANSDSARSDALQPQPSASHTVTNGAYVAPRNPWWLSAVQIISSMIGSGFLKMPHLVSTVGWIIFSFEIVIFSVSTWACCLMLVEAARHTGLYSTPAVTERVLGSRWRTCLEVNVCIYMVGGLSTYFNVIGDLGSTCMNQWTDDDVFISSYQGFMFTAALLVLPFLLMRHYAEMSVLSVIALLLCGGVISILGVEGNNQQGGHGDKVGLSNAAYHSLGSFAYAMSCQFLIVEAFVGTKLQDRPKFEWSLLLAITVGAFIMVAIAVAGYTAFGDNVKNDAIKSMDVTKAWSQVAMMCTVVHLALYIPNDLVIQRMYAAILMGQDAMTMPFVELLILTIALISLPLALMLAVPQSATDGVFSFLIDLTGDVPIGISCYVIPPMVYLGLPEEAQSVALKRMAYGTLILGSVLVIVCPVCDIIAFIDACTGSGCNSY